MVERGYGHDETDDWESLAEAERREDGTVRLRLVQVEKHTGARSTGEEQR